MKVIIAGSRNITEYELVVSAFQESQYEVTQIVSGGARGVDKLGERIAKEWNLPLVKFIPNWDEKGKRAGILRNIDMGNYADVLIALWDGKSSGTKHMIDYMKSLNKPVEVHIIE